MTMTPRLRPVRVWLTLARTLVQFVFGNDGFAEVSTVGLRPEWIRKVMLLQLLGFRRRDGIRWPYRPRVARLVRRLNRRLPVWIAYRGVLLPLCALNLARMTSRNVQRFGRDLQERTALTPASQFADILGLCLTHPGTLPTEYYVFGMHEPSMARRAPEFANGYEVEMLASLVRPARNPLHGSGFVSEELEWLNDKEQFRTLCRRAAVATPQPVAMFAGGGVQWHGVDRLPEQDLFLKPLRGGGGYGAARVFYDDRRGRYRVDTQVAMITTLAYPDAPLTAADLVEWLKNAGRELPFIVQPRLKAHPELIALVGDTTLPTLRVVTLADNQGACRLLDVYLRAASTDSSVDNISSGGVAALVDPSTGQLGAATTSVGGPVSAHPMTGRAIAGSVVPMVEEVCRQSLCVHKALVASQEVPVPVVGWDVAVTDAGPVFIEGNTLSDLSTLQKLRDRGCWTDAGFMSSIASWLVPIAGRRISLDPASDNDYERLVLPLSERPSASI